MLHNYKNSTSLLAKVVDTDLYIQLIQQLNKDFGLIGLTEEFNLNNTPIDLKNKLQLAVKKLIQTNTVGYYNLLYRIDISETTLKEINTSDIDKYIEEVTFLILQRIWKKVYYKNKFSS